MGSEFHMKFVKPKDGEPEPTLLEAFNMLKEHGLKPEWMEQAACLDVEAADKNCAYVIDPFEGPAFDHLKLLACRVYGAQCILASLNMKIELPQKKRPIYNVAMKGVIISCTSLEKKIREHVHHMVEMMAGEASRNLVEEVTHLVAGEVGSQKYTVAASRGTSIMTADWVYNVWDKAQHRYVHATDSEFAQFRCPIFKGLVVTVSGLSPDERKQVKHYVENEGGTYTGEMKMNHCTHLIVKEPKGQKYDYACKWKVHIVTLKWLYESLDKNFCQDEKKYPVTSNNGASGVKTSTPERSRLSAVRPSISDISAISLTHIDDTACTTTRLLNDTTAENFDALDVSCAPREQFIESCRLYLSSGIRGALLEKCRRIINTGGATRFSEINENVTHVVMEEKIDNEINTINNMDLRPHVVNAVWLAECFRQGQHVGEEPFLSPHLLVSELELPKLQVSNRKSLGGSRRSVQHGKPAEPSISSSAVSTAAKEVRNGGDDDDVAQLLSQYMDQSTKEGDTTAQPVDEVDGNTTASSTTSRQGRESTITDDNSDATQDPDGDTTVAEAGIFGRKTFVFFDFPDVEAMVENVTQAGGVCLKDSRRKVADYGVVPLFSCPVEQTVGEVVTDAWLQMCLLSEELLPVSGSPFFQPIDIDESTRPLEGCVLSVSGYTGVERDCLIHIADKLGAVCQEYFSRKATKTLQASTHLIVKEASGQKYTAAKKWKLPTVSQDWLLACARSGKREKEEKFDVNNINNDTNTSQIYQQEPPAAKPATSNAGKEGSEAATKNATTPKPLSNKPELAQPSLHSKPQNVSPEESSFQSKQPNRRSTISKPQETNSADAKTHKQTELAPPSSSADSVKSIPASSTERVPSSLASDHERNDLAARSSDDVNNPMGSVKSMVQQQGMCSLSQKENLTATVKMKGGLATYTPVRGRKGCHGRVEELQQQSRKPILSPGLESPSVFLAPGYRPNFNLKAVFEYLKTPEGPQKGQESPTLEEVFRHHLAEGVKNSSMARTADNLPPSSQNSQAEERGALEGVVISVSKKLGVNQNEYNRIVVELGGDYTWQYSDSCTHFIFQGRVNDLNKEYRLAKSQGKIIVSPHWLYACVEQRLRVDESMYPHSYNPNLNLGGVVKTETPSRSVRRSARKTPKHDDDNAQAQTTTTKTPARLRSEPKTPAKAAAESWEESMNEMKKWQQSGASNTKTPKDSGKKRLGAVVEVSTLQTSPSKREEKGGGNEKARTSSAESLSSNDERNGDSTAGGDVEISTEIQESECRVQEEVKVTEVTAAESGGSLEIREALTKTLESMKASSSRSKKSSKRRNRRTDPNSSGDQTNLSGILPDASRHASPWETNHAAQGAAHTAESFGGEASQSVQITWDDPTGRREQERLAHKLDMVCGQSQNTQNTEDFMANMDMPDLNHTADGSKVDCVPARQHPVRSPTPEPPPLAFPTAKNVCKILSPQPVELLSEESSESHSDRDVKPIILTSGMGPQERIEYAEVVERLGGTVLEKQQFDPACTHVVVIKPSRNEKFLAAVATGRWVLHKSYLIACRQEGKFVREESHEWGNPAMSHLMQSLDGQTYNLVQAAFKWRQKVHSMRKSDPSCKGAFQGWRVILLTEPKREENFKRLLSAGGATIVSVKPPFTEVSATHAFVELHKVKLLENDLQALVCGVDHILKPEFIAAHLTEQAPAPENHTPAEIVNLRASLQQDQSRKRKAVQTDGNNINISSSNKRLRR